MKPTIPAAITQPRWSMVIGLTSRRIASYPAMTADRAIIRMTNRPARSSARP